MFMCLLCTCMTCFTCMGQMAAKSNTLGRVCTSSDPFRHLRSEPKFFTCVLQSFLAEVGPCCSKLQQHVADFQSQTLRNRPIFKIYNAIHRVNFSSSVLCLGWAKFLRVVVCFFFFCLFFFLFCLSVLFGFVSFFFFFLCSLRRLMGVIDQLCCFSADLIGFVRPKWSQSLVEAFEGLY